MGKKSGPKWRGVVVQKVLGLCAGPLGTKADEPLQIRTRGYGNNTKHVENNPQTKRRRGARQKREMDGKSREKKKEESQGRSARGQGKKSKFEVSCDHQNWKTKERCPKWMVI